MPDSTLDPILATLTYEMIAMLSSFREERSFKELAARYGRDERTVSRQLLELDQAFWDTQRVHIIERELGRRTYRLTKAGEVFVNGLDPVPEMTRSAINAATALTRRIPILCTSNCLPRLRELSDALPSGRSFDIVPENRRTAEIDLTFDPDGPDRDIQLCLSSALMSSEQHPIVGRVTHWNDRVEVLPLRLDPLTLLSAEDLGFEGQVTVRQVVESGVTFLIPRGGVVWEFLNRGFTGWWKLRPFQDVSVGDLDGGLKCLASGLVPRSAMVVHGLNPDELTSYGFDRVYTYDFAGTGAHLMAIIGVFRVWREREATELENPYDLIWKTAQSLWNEEGGR
jgi:hypothetical protein